MQPRSIPQARISDHPSPEGAERSVIGGFVLEKGSGFLKRNNSTRWHEEARREHEEREAFGIASCLPIVAWASSPWTFVLECIDRRSIETRAVRSFFSDEEKIASLVLIRAGYGPMLHEYLQPTGWKPVPRFGNQPSHLSSCPLRASSCLRVSS